VKAPKRGLYLLHFDPPYKHAGHYLGYGNDVWQRMHEHRHTQSKSSPLVRAALANGSTVVLARIWRNGDRTLERRLKRQGGLSRHCPFCRVRGTYHR
jgi:hypothetical protein